MQAPSDKASLPERTLALTRVIDAPPERVYRVWTTQLPQWWGPHGMTTPSHKMDLRPGGVFRTVMRAPDGSEYPTQGIFLEVVPNRRLVFTDAFGLGWEPSPDIFFTADTTFDPLPGGRTQYTARALHWTVEHREKHERMGFHQGWGESMDRLVAVVMQG
ncbi:MAG: SRPBCC family protein [Opitutaceae bacterium]|nr:SRPBCC family protein [Opitutaceae bacterium]